MHSRILFLVLPILSAVSLFAQPKYPYVVTTIAGDHPIGDDGAATQAYLNRPGALAVDGNGTVFIADVGHNRIRRVGTAGVITTLAGPAGYAGLRALTPDGAGGVYFLQNGTWVRRLQENGTVTDVAGGAGAAGFGGDGGPPANGRFNASGLAFCPFRGTNLIYIADTGNHRIRVVLNGGLLQTALGNGTAGYTPDGPTTTAATVALNSPSVVACSADGESVYFADTGNRRIRRISGGRMTTIAGNGATGIPGNDTVALQAPLPATVNSLWVSAGGAVYFTDTGRVYQVTAEGRIRWAAGNGFGNAGDGGAATNALFENVTAVAGDRAGNLFIVDRDSDLVRRVDASSGIIRTFAGRSRYSGGASGALRAALHWPGGIAVDALGNVVFADERNHVIRKIDESGAISTVAGTGIRGFTGDGGAATAAQLNAPTAVAVGPDGAVYIADTGNRRIRRVGADGIITTLAGTGAAGGTGDNGAATQATFQNILAVNVDRQGDVYVGDAGTDRVRRISGGQITAFAGNGTEGFSGDGTLATAARLCNPWSTAFLRDGSALIVDACNFRIRRVTPNGLISTWAGNGTAVNPIFSADGIDADSSIGTARHLEVDGAGQVYFTRDIMQALVIGTDHKAYRVTSGRSPTSGDGGFALDAGFENLRGLALTAAGDLYVTDFTANRIRKLTLNAPARLEITSGNAQSAEVGVAFANALRVRVMGRAGMPVEQETVSFVVTQGAAVLSAATARTGPDGVAGVGVTAGTTAGEVVITATVAGVTAATFRLTVAGTAVPEIRVPVISDVTVAGAAALRVLAPFGLAAIEGTNLAAGEKRLEPAEGRYPTAVEGVCVEFGGVRAPLVSISPTRIVAQVPDVVAGNAPVTVTGKCGTETAVRSEAKEVVVTAAAPVFFSAGESRHVAALNEAGKPVGPAELGADYVYAQPGQEVTIFGTGFGQTEPGQTAGAVPEARAATVLTPKVMLGERELTVSYCGSAPGRLGTYLVVVKIPEAQEDGDWEVVVTLGEASSPVGAVLGVRK